LFFILKTQKKKKKRKKENSTREKDQKRGTRTAKKKKQKRKKALRLKGRMDSGDDLQQPGVPIDKVGGDMLKLTTPQPDEDIVELEVRHSKGVTNEETLAGPNLPTDGLKPREVRVEGPGSWLHEGLPCLPQLFAFQS